MVGNNTDGAAIAMLNSPGDPRASIPSGMISRTDFDRILPAAQAGQLTVAGPIPAAELQAVYRQVMYVHVCMMCRAPVDRARSACCCLFGVC